MFRAGETVPYQIVSCRITAHRLAETLSADYHLIRLVAGVEIRVTGRPWRRREGLVTISPAAPGRPGVISGAILAATPGDSGEAGRERRHSLRGDPDR